MKPYDGGPAFPKTEYNGDTDKPFNQLAGMSLRDYFAAKALPAIIGRLAGEGSIPNDGSTHSYLSEQAFRIADAMLKERTR